MLTLIRHTTPAVAPGTCYGRLDVPLAGSFEEEAQRLLATLPAFDSLYTSPLRRCWQLAEVIGAERNLQPIALDTLAEMDFGRWEGLPWQDIARAELDAWADDFYHARPHGGESVAQLHARVSRALSTIKDLGVAAGIVTHSGVIKAALAPSPEQAAFDTKIDFGEWRTLP